MNDILLVKEQYRVDLNPKGLPSRHYGTANPQMSDPRARSRTSIYYHV